MKRVLAATLLTVVACGGSTSSAAIIASGPGTIGTGEQRILVSIVDTSTTEVIATPDIVPVATLRDRIGSPLGEYQGEFLWLIPDVRGMYHFRMDIPGPGTYQLTLDAGDLGDLGPIGFDAVDDPLQVAVGEEAPLSVSRTLDDASIEDLTSDPTPDESMYTMTVAEAIEAGPAVIAFATPAWCTSQSCGPMLDQVQAIKDDYPSVNFVHVEVFENIHVTSREDLVLVPAVLEWGLPTEPWLYVVDGGIVTAAFEGAVGDLELVAAIEAVAP